MRAEAIRVVRNRGRLSAKNRPALARRTYYQRSLPLLEERLPDSPLVRELADELGALLSHRALLARTR